MQFIDSLKQFLKKEVIAKKITKNYLIKNLIMSAEDK